MSILGLILLVVCALAIRLLWIGWRGKLIDNHPYCRRCGFDLSGRNPNTPRCTECGALLVSGDSIRRGRRAIRLGLLLAGGVVLLSGIASFFVVTWADRKGVSLWDYEPAWWLTIELQHGSGETRKDALRRLLDRYTQGLVSRTTPLSPSEIHATFDCILDLQADPRKRGIPGGGINSNAPTPLATSPRNNGSDIFLKL